MLHGANAAGWCFDKFRAVFEGQGFTCHAPDLIGHATGKANAGAGPQRRGHCFLLEPGAEEIARRIAEWIPA